MGICNSKNKVETVEYETTIPHTSPYISIVENEDDMIILHRYINSIENEDIKNIAIPEGKEKEIVYKIIKNFTGKNIYIYEHIPIKNLENLEIDFPKLHIKRVGGIEYENDEEDDINEQLISDQTRYNIKLILKCILKLVYNAFMILIAVKCA